MSGPQLMVGYHGMPTETANALRKDTDGKTWLYTGDIARMDDDGYFYIVDRKKDMALIGGFNVYPNAVEKVLAEHPAVLEVGVAAIPHPEKVGQEALKAWVVLRPGQTVTESELIDLRVETSGALRSADALRVRRVAAENDRRQNAAARTGADGTGGARKQVRQRCLADELSRSRPGRADNSPGRMRGRDRDSYTRPRRTPPGR